MASASASPVFSWENWEPSWAEAAGAGAWADDFDDDFVYHAEEFSQAEAGEELCQLIVDLKLQGKISAKIACYLSYWASKAGAAGPTSELALKPGAKDGSYSARFDVFTGAGVGSLNTYEVEVARCLKGDLGRRWDQLPFLPVHEVLLDELLEDSGPEIAFQKALAAGNLPPVWDSHPNVLAAQRAGNQPPRPFCIYVDGVQYSRRDTVLGFWCHWLYSSRKHLIFVLRKSESCECGCGGWCSLRPVWSAIKWSLSAFLQGVYPSKRHDGSDFIESDSARKTDAGLPMAYSGVCTFLKNDWAEIVQRWGFPAWNSVTDPCPFCKTCREGLYTLRGFSPFSMPHAEKTLADYELSCTAAERNLRLNDGLLRLLRNRLGFRKDRKGAGRCLIQAIASLGLERYDRLEATDSHPDIHKLEPEAGPRRITLWRTSLSMMTKQRNPLICAEAGISMRTFSIDWLHCLSMGVFPHFLGYVLDDLIRANAFDVPGGPGGMMVEQSLRKIKADLKEWYYSEAQANRHHTPITTLTKGMLTVKGKPLLQVFGAECNGFLAFAAQVLLPKYAHRLPPARAGNLSAGLESLVALLQVCRIKRGKLQPAEIQLFCDNVARHLQLLSALSIPCKPKHHEALEMGVRSFIFYKNGKRIAIFHAKIKSRDAPRTEQTG